MLHLHKKLCYEPSNPNLTRLISDVLSSFCFRIRCHLLNTVSQIEIIVTLANNEFFLFRFSSSKKNKYLIFTNLTE
jgi:hypothetical protein